MIRGPGGATWGANAVNGVINIITKSAGATAGAAVSVGAGTFDGTHVAARYGGKLGSVAYRVYSQWSGHGESQIDANTPADDSWQSQTHGFRLDWTGRPDTLMAEGGRDARPACADCCMRRPDPCRPSSRRWRRWQYTHEYHVLGRWTRRRDNGASLQVQSSVDFRHNDDSGQSRASSWRRRRAVSHRGSAARHDVVIGVGYRFLDEETDGGFAFSIAPKNVDETRRQRLRAGRDRARDRGST